MWSRAKVRAGTTFLVNRPSDSSVQDFRDAFHTSHTTVELIDYPLQTNQTKNARSETKVRSADLAVTASMKMVEWQSCKGRSRLSESVLKVFGTAEMADLNFREHESLRTTIFSAIARYPNKTTGRSKYEGNRDET